MFESDSSDSSDEINLSYKSVTTTTKKEEISKNLWAEHFSKPEKERNIYLTRIFEKEFKRLKSLYCFLEDDQVFGITLTKFGIPNICGKIDKKFFKLSSRSHYKVNKYEKRNKLYPSKPRILSKKISSTSSSSKQQNLMTRRYPLVVERWSDTALRKFKSGQRIPSFENYIFDDDNTLETSHHRDCPKKHSPSKTFPTPSLDADIQDEFVNKNVSNTNDKKGVESNENPSLKGLLRKIEINVSSKKSVRFNDSDLCSFAPTQEFSESISKEISNKETDFDDIKEDKCDSKILSRNDKQHEIDSNETKYRRFAEIASLDNRGVEKMGGRQNCELPIEKKTNFEKCFEIEPYDNENIVIEDFTESYTDSQTEVEPEQTTLQNSGPFINKTTNVCVLKPNVSIKIKVVEDDLRLQEDKPTEKADEDLNTENYINVNKYVLEHKTKMRIKDTEESLDSNPKTISEMSEKKVDTDTKCEIKKSVVSALMPPQQQSLKNESTIALNILESRDIVVPETPSSDEMGDIKSCISTVKNSNDESQMSKLSGKSLSNTYVPETPLSDDLQICSSSFSINKISLSTLEDKVTQKESSILKKSAHTIVEDWSDDEFILLSPSEPQTINENSTSIIAINGNIIDSRHLENNENSLKDSLNKVTTPNKNSVSSFENVSPCSSLSGRDYVSDSSQCESEEDHVPNKKKCDFSIKNTDFEMKNNCEMEQTSINPDSGNENEKNSNQDQDIEIVITRTSKESSDLRTPNSDQESIKLIPKENDPRMSAVNAPSKVENKACSKLSTVDKPQTNTSQDNNSSSHSVMKHESLNSLNQKNSLTENKVCKVLFPLQSSAPEVNNKADFNQTKLLCIYTKPQPIVNWKEDKENTEIKENAHEGNIEENKENCNSFYDISSQKDSNCSETVEGMFKSNTESFSYSPISTKSCSGGQQTDSKVTDFIESDNDEQKIQHKNANCYPHTQSKNKDSISVCLSAETEYNTNLSLHNKYALPLLEPPKETAATMDKVNEHQDSNPESFDIEEENTIRTVVIKPGSASQNEDIIVESEDISFESKMNNCLESSYKVIQPESVQEQKNMNTTLRNDGENIIYHKQKPEISIYDVNKVSEVSSTEDINDEPLQHGTTIITPAKEGSDTENIHGMESLAGVVALEHIKAANISNDITTHVTINDSTDTPPSSNEPTENKDVTPSDSSDINININENSKMERTLKNLNELESGTFNVINNNWGNDIQSERVELSDNKDPSRVLAPDSTPSVCSDDMQIPIFTQGLLNVSDTIRTADKDFKRIVSSKLTCQQQEHKDTFSSVKSDRVNTISIISSESPETLSNVTTETLFVKINNKENQNGNKKNKYEKTHFNTKAITLASSIQTPATPFKENPDYNKTNSDSNNSGTKTIIEEKNIPPCLVSDLKNKPEGQSKQMKTFSNIKTVSSKSLKVKKGNFFNELSLCKDNEVQSIQGRGGDNNFQVNKICHKSMQLTSNRISLPVLGTHLNKKRKDENITPNVIKYHCANSELNPKKQSKRYQVLTSENLSMSGINTSKSAQKHDMILNSNLANNVSLRKESIFMKSDLLPVKNWHNNKEKNQIESVPAQLDEVEVSKNSFGKLLSSENLSVVKNSSDKQSMTNRPDVQFSKGVNHSKRLFGYKTVTRLNLSNENQDNSKYDKYLTQKQGARHKTSTDGLSRMRVNNLNENNKQWDKQLSKLTYASTSNYLNKNLTCYSTSTIKSLRFGIKNRSENDSSIEISPPAGLENELIYLKDRKRDVNKLLDNDMLEESVLISEDESDEHDNHSVDCTSGKFSPLSSDESSKFLKNILKINSKSAQGSDGSFDHSNQVLSPSSSIRSDMSLNDISSSKCSTSQLKRRILDYVGNYSSEENNFDASPPKSARKNSVLQSKENESSTGGKIMSSDESIPPFNSEISEEFNAENLDSDDSSVDISPQYDHDMFGVNKNKSKQVSYGKNTLITDSTIPSYSEGLESPSSSPIWTDCEEANNSPFYDSNGQSSDNFLTDMFDD